MGSWLVFGCFWCFIYFFFPTFLTGGLLLWEKTLRFCDSLLPELQAETLAAAFEAQGLEEEREQVAVGPCRAVGCCPSKSPEVCKTRLLKNKHMVFFLLFKSLVLRSSGDFVLFAILGLSGRQIHGTLSL